MLKQRDEISSPPCRFLDQQTIDRTACLTGPESVDLEHYAQAFSEALGRPIRYRDVPLAGWSEKLLAAGIPAHIVKHLGVMTELNKQGRYDRMTDDFFKLTGEKPTSMRDFLKLHANEFTRRAPK